MGLTITTRAASELKRLFTEQGKPDDTVVRFGVSSGGCSGFEYSMELAETADQQEDLLQEMHGVRVAVDRRSLKFLEGTEVDFRSDLLKRGFVFNNPLAVRTCGCGSSFQA